MIIAGVAKGLTWEGVKVGEQLPELVLPITRLRAASHPAATRDYFPGHHDVEYAHAQGQPDIYVNTMFLHGVLDRLVLDWAGPAWFISRRKMAMLSSIYVGDTLTASGVVRKRRVTETEDRVVTIDIKVGTADGLRVTGETDLMLPWRHYYERTPGNE